MRVHQYLMGRAAMAPNVRHRQAGFSLVELMVALAIGLIVSLAVMIGYLGAAQSQRGQTDLSRLQESARFAFDLFGRETRNAGFANNTDNQPGIKFVALGTNTASNSMLAGSNDQSSPTLPDGSNPAVINKGDVITFRYYGSDTLDYTAADGTVLNCTGTAIRAQQMNEDTLYIARDPNNTQTDPAGEPTLFCASRIYSVSTQTWTAGTGSPVPVIPGIESMQFLYGEDTDADGVINHYVPAVALASPDFTQVNGIMASVVVRTPTLSGFSAAQTLNHFGTVYAPGNTAPANDVGSVFAAPGDARIRRVFNTVFSLRNKSISTSQI